jgi:hypothetical protein
MEYSKFSLGLRFAMTSDSNLTPNDCWNIMFSEVPMTHVAGATLFGAWDDVGAAESEGAYICMFSNLPLKVGKALFAQLQQKPVLLSYLTIYRPFIQNNRVEKCSVVDYLGQVQPDGSVTGGEANFGVMRISGTLPEVCEIPGRSTRILIAPDAWAGKFTSADAARHMLRSASRVLPKAMLRTQLIADGGQGTIDALVCSNNGRYLKANITTDSGEEREIHYGILPNRTIVIESETLSETELTQALTLPQNKGFTEYIVAAGTGVLPDDVPDGRYATVLGKRIPASQRNNVRVEYRNGIETVLEECEFNLRLARADWLIALTRLLDDAGSMKDATTDALLFHCRVLRKHVAVLAFTDDGRFFAKVDDAPLVPIETTSFEEAADALFLIIKNTPILPAPLFAPALREETVMSEL